MQRIRRPSVPVGTNDHDPGRRACQARTGAGVSATTRAVRPAPVGSALLMEDHPASNVKTDGGLRIGSSVVRRARASGQRWRLATARLRALPYVVIIGAQRGG